MKRNLLVTPKRIVIKIGSSLLTSQNLRLNRSRIKNLVAQIAALIERKIEVIVVTSGAIGAGMGLLNLAVRPKLLPRQQAAAAIGQSELMHIYAACFRRYHLLSAQILLTREDLISRQRYLNAKNTLFTILSYGAIPIINENDTVSVDEIKFGDNDRLSALVANLAHADWLIILSDVEGLLAPGAKKERLISMVEKITPEIEKMARGSKSKVGTGGMSSKIEAAKICSTSGISCIVANGKTADILVKLVDGENLGTLFLPKGKKLVAKKRWIGFGRFKQLLLPL